MKDFDTLDISLVVSDIALQDKPSEEAVRKEIIRHIADVLALQIASREDWLREKDMPYGREYRVQLAVSTPEQYLEHLHMEATRLSYILRSNR